MKYIKIIIIALLTGGITAFAAGKLQDSNFASLSDITGAGGTASQLLNTSKIYDNVNAQVLNTTLGAKLDTSAFTDSAVTSKLITGFSSGAGSVAGTDTILQAINKLDGNTSAKMTNPMTTAEDLIKGGASGSPTRLAVGSNGQCLTVSGGSVGWGTCGTSSPLTTKGDLYTYDTGNARLPVGTDGQVLTADSAQSTGIKWATSTAGDFSSNTATSVDGEVVLFSGTGGKTGKRATGTGYAKLSSGVLSTQSTPLPVADTTISTQAIGASAIDWSTGSVFTKTLGANTTFTFSNQTSGQTIVVRLTNTASNYTVTWPTVKWPGGTVPVMSTGATSDVYTFVYDGTNIYGSYVQDLQ